MKYTMIRNTLRNEEIAGEEGFQKRKWGRIYWANKCQ